MSDTQTPPDANCIFCKIVAGRIPCHKILEDQTVLAFLDIEPLSRGHALVIPKAHYEKIDQVPDEVAASCAAVIPRLSRAIMAATGGTAWNVLQNNGRMAHQAVGHVHFHIIPKTDEAGLGMVWPTSQLEDEEARKFLAMIAERL